MFFIDLVVNFFTAYFDKNDILIVNRRKIFIHYVTGWFLLDFFACFPFQHLAGTDGDYNSLLRVLRIQRLYRVVKLAKLMRMLKVMKFQSKIFNYISVFLNFTVQQERLIYFVLTLLVVVHVVACLWYIVAKFHEFANNT